MSERTALRAVLRHVAINDLEAVILANCHVNGRQIDLLVGLPNQTSIVEVKASHSPLRGGVNGDWETKRAGGWLRVRNYYQQALDAKNAVRDALTQFKGVDVPYPHGAVVYVPRVPTQSSVPSTDFKIDSVGLADLPQSLAPSTTATVSLADLERFAEAIGLDRVGSADVACSQKLYDAERRIGDYKAEFAQQYAVSGEFFIPTRYSIIGAALTMADMLPRLQERDGLLLEGPSGCGKTMLARRLANEGLAQYLPIFLQAKNFAGTLKASVDAEVALLGARSAGALIKDALVVGLRPLFVIDGFNECDGTLQLPLVRSLRAAARRYGSAHVLTTNTEVPRVEMLDASVVRVHPPELKDRRTIAEGPDRQPLPQAAGELLSIVSTGLEAALLREVGDAVQFGASRFVLFDTFMRRRSGSAAAEVIRLLAIVAERLLDLVTFSLSARELQRLLEREGIRRDAFDIAVRTGLLTLRRDRVSFGHELFMNASAAEAVARRLSCAAEIAAALRLPKHDQQKALIIGAIERPDLLADVLSCVDDIGAVQSCLDGECGQEAQNIVRQEMSLVRVRAVEEAGRLTFELDDAAMWNVRISEASIFHWSKHDGAIVVALSSLLWQEPELSSMLEGFKAIDDQIAIERQQLREDAKARGVVGVYSAMFAASHVFSQTSGPALARISSRLASGLLLRGGERDMSAAFGHIARTDLSPGQLYVLLAMFRGAGLEQYAKLAAHLPRLFQEHWRGAPYHLKLDMLDACHKCWKAPQNDQARIVETLQGLVTDDFSPLNSVLIDALGALGALEDEERNHAAQLRTLLRSVLDNPTGDGQAGLAWHLYYGQFDHPYSGAYCEVISELEPAERKLLLATAAVAAAQEESDLFTVPLIMELTKYLDGSLASLITPWTRPPRPDSVMRDESVGSFRGAWIALGVLGFDFEHPKHSDGGAAAFSSYGEVLYWLNRKDLDPLVREERAKRSFADLAAHRIDLVVGILADTESRDSWTMWENMEELGSGQPVTTVRNVLGGAVADLCRKYLTFSGIPHTYFRYPDTEKMMDFCIQTIGMFGTSSDITALQKLTGDRRHGRAAIAAVKSIEDRTYS